MLRGTSLLIAICLGAGAAEAPPPSPASRELGFQLGRDGKMREAYALLSPWVATHPEDGPARMALVQAAIELELAEEARALLAPLPVEAPPVRVLRAQVARLSGEPREVQALLAPLLTAPPPGLEGQVLWLQADALVATGKPREAADALRPRATSDPRLGLLYAQAAYLAGEVEPALGVLGPWARRMLLASAGSSTPPDATAAPILLEYGRMLVALGRGAEGVPMLEAGLRLKPQSAQGWLNLGQALASLGRKEEAARALARFRELSAPGAAERPPGDSAPPGARPRAR